MQVLLTWKSQGLSDAEAVKRWTHVLNTYKTVYQPLVNEPLQLASTYACPLFLGLIYVPDMFLVWQEFYEDDSYGVAWAGISHNLVDRIPQDSINQMNVDFVSQLKGVGDSFLRDLEGRFAVSVLDRKAENVRILTTQSGLTPCFWTTGKYGIAVGTRIAPLLDLVGRKCVPDRIAMVQMFAMDWTLGSRTPFEGVSQVNPGMELRLSKDESDINEHCYSPPQRILEQANVLSRENYLKIGSDAVNHTITCQMRHSVAPLMNLTGGMDSRALVASAVALGFHPECDVSGTPHSEEIKIASRVAEAMHVKLHCFHPGAHYAEELSNTLRLWCLWTEGTIPAHISFARSVGALSPTSRTFYAAYRQSFSGIGGVGPRGFYGPEMLSQLLSPSDITTLLFHKYRNTFLTKEENLSIKTELQDLVSEAIHLGLTGHKIIDYFYWRERVSRWGGYALDMQQFGRHVFAPLCQPLLTAVLFAMSGEENLSAAWHRYHIQRMCPGIAEIPFLKPPPLSGVRKLLLEIHPSLYSAVKAVYTTRKRKKLSAEDREKLGKYFHPYFQELLFSGDEWWPNVIQYEKGQKIWDNFIREKEGSQLWKLITIELWARNFLT